MTRYDSLDPLAPLRVLGGERGEVPVMIPNSPRAPRRVGLRGTAQKVPGSDTHLVNN